MLNFMVYGPYYLNIMIKDFCLSYTKYKNKKVVE